MTATVCHRQALAKVGVYLSFSYSLEKVREGRRWVDRICKICVRRCGEKEKEGEKQEEKEKVKAKEKD